MAEVAQAGFLLNAWGTSLWLLFLGSPRDIHVGLATLAIADDRRVTVAGDLELPSQQAVNEQSCLGVVEGSLRITGTAADLAPLAPLYHIGGGLEIVGTPAVTLSGLEGVAEVGGSIVIADNAGLTTLSFQSYMSAFGDVTIQNNDALASLTGAEFIGQCAPCVGDLEISDHATMSTADAEAFAAGVAVVGATTICGNLDGTVCP